MSPVPVLIATISQNGIIGQQGRRPWHFPEEMARLRRTISGKPLIAGRKTFFAMRTLLPRCHSVVLSREPSLLREGSYRDYRGYGYWFVDNMETAYSFAEGFARQNGQSEYFIIGGSDIFHQSIGHARRLHLTTLHQDYDGDCTMPGLGQAAWTEQYRENRDTPSGHNLPHSFTILDRPD